MSKTAGKSAAKSARRKTLNGSGEKPAANGVLPDAELDRVIKSGAISADGGLLTDQIQPASLDLRLGKVAYRLRASFLPGKQVVADRLDDSLVMHTLDLTRGAVLETGCVYLVPLQERLKLPADLSAAANPKSSTGRIDVFVRAVSDRARAFDGIPAGYAGELYAEISPRTFSVLARTGDRLLQLRLRRGPQTPVRDMTFSLDLHPTATDIVGYRAKRHSRVIDLAAVGAHSVEDFWEPVRAREGRIVLDPGEFYILASKEKIVIPLDEPPRWRRSRPSSANSGRIMPASSIQALGSRTPRARPSSKFARATSPSSSSMASPSAASSSRN